MSVGDDNADGSKTFSFFLFLSSCSIDRLPSRCKFCAVDYCSSLTGM